jgi:hypothetical protein
MEIGTVEELSSIPDQIHVGDVVKITAVDWNIYESPVSQHTPFEVARADLYGQVMRVTDRAVSIAPQVFTDGYVRYPLTVPLSTIERVEILARADS